MDASGDKAHNGQMLDHDPFLFYREQITCSREDWIARRFVLRAAGFLGRRERNV
jgi:hypothetical protein